MYPTFINLHEDENDHLLLDMDSLVLRRSNYFASRGCEPAKKKCPLGNKNIKDANFDLHEFSFYHKNNFDTYRIVMYQCRKIYYKKNLSFYRCAIVNRSCILHRLSKKAFLTKTCCNKKTIIQIIME